MKKYTMGKLFMFLSLLLMGLICLLLPAPFSILPMLILAAAAALLGTWALEDEWSSPDWGVTGRLDRSHPIVSVNEELFRGPYREVADVRMPFETVTPDRFRGQQSAMLLSAAIALTDNPLSDAATQSLNIQRNNFRQRFPAVGEVTVDGITGRVVRDGSVCRAYFAAGPELVQSCELLLAGQSRKLTQADLDRLVQLPGVHYATAPVENGEVGPLTYLGSAKTRPIATLDPDAMAAYQALVVDGYDVRFIGTGELIRETGAPIRAAAADKGLTFIPLRDGVVRFDEAMHQRRRYQASIAALRLRTLVTCLLAVIIGALMGNVLLGELGVMLACLMAPRHAIFRAPDKASVLVGASVLTLGLCAAVALFQQLIGYSLSLSAFLVCGWTLTWVVMPYLGRPRVHWRRILASVLMGVFLMTIPIAAMALALNGEPIASLPMQLNLPALGFGLCIGLFIGLVSSLPLRRTDVD